MIQENFQWLLSGRSLHEMGRSWMTVLYGLPLLEVNGLTVFG